MLTPTEEPFQVVIGYFDGRRIDIRMHTKVIHSHQVSIYQYLDAFIPVVEQSERANRACLQAQISKKPLF